MIRWQIAHRLPLLERVKREPSTIAALRQRELRAADAALGVRGEKLRKRDLVVGQRQLGLAFDRFLIRIDQQQRAGETLRQHRTCRLRIRAALLDLRGDVGDLWPRLLMVPPG